ncbi:MAG: TlpA disulfide reductase family protein [bacterium]|nr:TlpA disulfide reductase family protein [bacterium]
MAKTQVLIEGQINNAPPKSTLKITCYKDNINYKEILSKSIPLNANGSFKLTLAIPKTAFSQLVIGDEYTNLFLVKNKHLKVSIEYQNFDKSVHYEGNGAADNNFMAGLLLAENELYHGPYITNKERDAYLHFEDSLTSLQLKDSTFIPKSNYSPEFVKFINDQPVYKTLFSQWLYSRQYKVLSYISKTPPYRYNYFDFLQIYKFKVTKMDELTSFLVHENDIISNFSVPDSIEGLTLDEALMLKNLMHRQFLYIDNKRDYQLTRFLRYNLGDVKEDLSFVETIVNDYKIVCTNPEYNATIDSVLNQIKTIQKGKPAPAFTLTDVSGKKVALSDFIGKVVFIDFWATWCGPCIEELPASHQLMNTFKEDKNVVFLYINVMDDKKKWNQYLTKKNAEGIQLFADEKQSNSLMFDYVFNGIPTYVLIDTKGQILSTTFKYPISENLQNLAQAIREAAKQE